MTNTEAVTQLEAAMSGQSFPWNGTDLVGTAGAGEAFCITLAAVAEPLEPFFGPWQWAWITDEASDEPALETTGPYFVQLLGEDTTPIAERTVANAVEAIVAVSEMWANQFKA
jgi:hypothetical protein